MRPIWSFRWSAGEATETEGESWGRLAMERINMCREFLA